MILAVEDATLLQIVTLILTFLTTSLGTYLTFRIAKMNKAQIAAEVQVAHVITKVDTIEKHTNSLTEQAVARAEEMGTLAGTLAEKERVAEKATGDKLLTDIVHVEVQKRLLELTSLTPAPVSNSPTIEKKLGTIGTDVEEVKTDVKDVKGRVTK